MDISAILSDPESLKQIKELAEMFGSQLGISAEQGAEKDEHSDSDVKHDGNADHHHENPAHSPPPPPFPASHKKDPNIELLIALKPHLSPQRREKVDKSLKILRMLEMFISLKESGLLNDLL